LIRVFDVTRGYGFVVSVNPAPVNGFGGFVGRPDPKTVILYQEWE